MKQSSIEIGQLDELKPTVNFANKMSTWPGQAWGPRMIPDSQLIYVISGQATLTLGPQTYKLSGGDCVFFGSNSPHWLVSSKKDPFSFASIHFNWNHESPQPVHPGPRIKGCRTQDLSIAAQSYSIDVPDYGQVYFPFYLSLPNLESLFLQIVREYRFEEYGYASILRGLLIQLLTTIIRHQISGQFSSAARRKVAPALEAMRKKPHISWTTTELANLCGYHPTYFAQLFNEATGHSPKHFFILERIRKAKNLLLEAETIEEVAQQLGYSSAHYFCRNFKLVTGLTPTQFKQHSIEL